MTLDCRIAKTGRIRTAAEAASDALAWLRDVRGRLPEVDDLFCRRVTDSPVEAGMVAMLERCGWHLVATRETVNGDALVSLYNVVDVRAVFRCDRPSPVGDWTLLVQPTVEAELHRYRPDFAMYTGGEAFAVEVDGHDYHERTHGQAFRDKTRDRDLVFEGYHVLRFTGGEVHYKPEWCVRHMREAAQDCIDRKMRRERLVFRLARPGADASQAPMTPSDAIVSGLPWETEDQ